MMDLGSLDEKGLPPGYPFDPDWEITPRDLKRLLDAGGADAPLVVDVRRVEEHKRARIDGTVLAPLQELSSHVDTLRAHEERLIVTQCHHGRRSLQAAEELRAQGFPRVLSLAGGIELWSRDIDPSVPRY